MWRRRYVMRLALTLFFVSAVVLLATLAHADQPTRVVTAYRENGGGALVLRGISGT